MLEDKSQIREATEQDYDTVNSLYCETYILYHTNIPESYNTVPKRTLPKGTFLNMLEDKESLVVVAEIAKSVVGVLYATIEKDDGDEWTRGYHRVSVEELSISKKYQRQGIGKVLMQKAEDWAKAKGIADMTVLVYAFNENALCFYEKVGYQPYSVKLNKKIEK
jgi:ribosomal protein S18 acetylase RimI-like enzyme